MRGETRKQTVLGADIHGDRMFAYERVADARIRLTVVDWPHVWVQVGRALALEPSCQSMTFEATPANGLLTPSESNAVTVKYHVPRVSPVTI